VRLYDDGGLEIESAKNVSVRAEELIMDPSAPEDAMEFGYGSLVYKSISELKKSYELAKTDKQRKDISELAKEVRRIGRRYGENPLVPNIPAVGGDNIQGYTLCDTEKVLLAGHPLKGSMLLFCGEEARQRTKQKREENNQRGEDKANGWSSDDGNGFAQQCPRAKNRKRLWLCYPDGRGQNENRKGNRRRNSEQTN
jgi:hypothetical protein